MISISSTLACRRKQLYKSAVRFSSTSPSGQPFSDDDDETQKARKAYTGNPHPRNSFQGTYDMDRLVSCSPALSPYVIKGPTGRPTVNWADPIAVRALNTALLVADYNVNPSYSDILPQDALVPPIPGRADYVHHMADLLQKCISNDNDTKIPKGSGVIGFDIGTGASCIYATIAAAVYGWRMIASDINTTSLESAQKTVKANSHDDLIDIRHQKSETSIFDGILEQDERIDFCMCNPPFYYNREDFVAENARKLKGLAKSRGRRQLKEKDLNKAAANKKGYQVMASSNNFGGLESELICKGGEVRFVKRIFNESKLYWDKCLWFTSLVSRYDNLKKIKSDIKNKRRRRTRKGDREIKMIDQIPIGAGKKKSNILIWTFMDEDERRDWARSRD